jgi:hypothetical protein
VQVANQTTLFITLGRIFDLQRFGDGLWKLSWNGHNPMSRRRFSPMYIGQIADSPRRQGGTSDQEIIVGAARKVTDQLCRA